MVRFLIAHWVFLNNMEGQNDHLSDTKAPAEQIFFVKNTTLSSSKYENKKLF